MDEIKNQREEIVEFGKKLMEIDKIEEMLESISTEAKKLVKADRCSIFVVDEDNNALWTKHNDQIETIVIPLDAGIAGNTYKSKKVQIVNTPYENPNFLSAVGEKNNYVAKNIIAVPVSNSKDEVIAIIELLNKQDSDFDEKDADILLIFSNFVSGALELSLLD
jgi:GAF domain-containing protein